MNYADTHTPLKVAQDRIDKMMEAESAITAKHWGESPKDNGTATERTIALGERFSSFSDVLNAADQYAINELINNRAKNGEL